MEKRLYSVEEVSDFIKAGKIMSLAASEKTLRMLPKGNWIGGTTPYFMDLECGKINDSKIFIDDFTCIAEDFRIERFSASNISTIVSNSFENGFTILILPFDTAVSKTFALNSLSYDEIYRNPVVGYVAAVRLEELGREIPANINGTDLSVSTTEAIVLHIKLPNNKVARAEIFNLDSINKDSDEIVFPVTSFVQSDCLINGKKANIAQYLSEKKYVDAAPRPLITNINGALINRDIREINVEKGEVSFFSPAYEDDIYHVANISTNYYEDFNKILKDLPNKPIYSVICVSYLLLGELEGKKINVEGVFALGEIAFQLLNKTLVVLEIDES